MRHVVLDTSVVLPAVLSPRGYRRRFFVLLAFGALAARRDLARLEADALRVQADIPGSDGGRRQIDSLVQDADARYQRLSKLMPPGCPDHWRLVASPPVLAEYERPARQRPPCCRHYLQQIPGPPHRRGPRQRRPSPARRRVRTAVEKLKRASPAHRARAGAPRLTTVMRISLWGTSARTSICSSGIVRFQRSRSTRETDANAAKAAKAVNAALAICAQSPALSPEWCITHPRLNSRSDGLASA